jgi:membrane protein DedA with SNARE-associated domain
MSAAKSDPQQLTGLTGLFADVIDALGEVGVGVLTLLETLIPPVPSEVVLPLSGFLAQQGRLPLVWVLIAATVGSVIGAWGFYLLGAKLGLDRSIEVLAKVPLLDAEDLRSAADWFARHGKGAVFFGRFVPGVRSLISLPAGAERMSPALFTLWTTLGSGLWNGALVGGGYGLGTQWDTVGSFVGTVSNILLAVLMAGGVLFLWRRSRRRHAAAHAPRPADPAIRR